jgi:hypothetical protein
MRGHELKCWPESFRAIVSGVKTAEFRVNDRDFQVGDVLRLWEWRPDTEEYTKHITEVVVTHVQLGGEFGIPAGYVMLSIALQEETDGKDSA